MDRLTPEERGLRFSRRAMDCIADEIREAVAARDAEWRKATSLALGVCSNHDCAKCTPLRKLMEEK